VILFGLVLMVLVRLIWMQLRHYPISIDSHIVPSLDFVNTRFDGECRSTRPLLRVVSEPLSGSLLAQNRNDRSILWWFTHPGAVFLGFTSCLSDLSPEDFYVKWNQWILGITVLGAAFLVRFCTSSWTAAAVAATVLLSRGRFLADIGVVSSKSVLQCLTTLWLAAGAHFFRSGSVALAIFGALCVMVASVFDGATLILSLALPIFLILGFSQRKRLAKPMIRRFRGQPGDLIEIPAQSDLGLNDEGSFLRRMGKTVRWVLGTEVPSLMRLPTQRPDYRRGGVFFTLKVPFLLWAFYRRRWLTMIFFGFMAFGFGMLLLVISKCAVLGSKWVSVEDLIANISMDSRVNLINAAWMKNWLEAGRLYWDTHYTLSFVVLLVCGFISPARGLPAYWETVWLMLIALIGLATFCLLGDLLDSLVVAAFLPSSQTLSQVLGIRTLLPREFFSWMEPCVLSLSVAGIYNLIEVLDSRSLTNLSKLKDTRGLK
jgi:hypothetical protein